MADPITEELALELDQALADVGRIDDALQQVASGFKVALSDAIGVLSESVRLPDPDIDGSVITAEVETAIAAGADGPVVVDTDASSIAPAIADEIVEASGTPVVLDADASAVAGEVIGAVEGLDVPAVDVPVAADTADATADLADLATVLPATLDATVVVDTDTAADTVATFVTDAGATGVVVPVDADATELRDEIVGAVAAVDVPSIDVPVVADTEDAAAELSALPAVLPTQLDLSVEADTAAATDALGDLAALAQNAADPVLVPVDADVTRVDDEILAAVAGIDPPPIDVAVTADTAGAESSLDALAQVLPDAAEVTVTADTASATTDLEAVAALAVDVAETPIVVPVEADTASLRDDIDRAVDAIDAPPIEATVEIDTAQAETDLALVPDALDDTLEVTVTADTSEATGALDAFEADSAGTTVTVGIDGDTAQAASAIEEVVVPQTIDIDADVAAAQEAIASLAADPISLEVDTGGATAGQQELQEELGQTTTAAQSTSEGMLGVAGATTLAGSAAGVAKGELGGLSGTAGLLGANAGLAAGGIAAIGASAFSMAKDALDAQAALFRFQQTFGAFADDVEHIDVGTLHRDLSDLALSLGSDDDALRNVASSFFLFQRNAGTSAEAAAAATQEMIGLAARAVALNPALGSVEDVADRMGRALARGGRFAAEFQISLTPIEIKAKAAENASRGLGDGVGFAALQLAGAQLAAEKYGKSLDDDIAKGVANPLVQLRALTQGFREATEEIGKPLIAPFLDVVREAIPLGVATAQIVADLAQAGLPALEGFLEVLGGILTLLEPVISLLDKIPDPVFAAAGAFLAVQVAIAGVVRLLPAVALETASAFGGIGLVLGAVGALVVGIQSLGGGSEETAAVLPDLAEQLVKVRDAADGSGKQIIDLTANVRDLLRTGEFGDLGDLLLGDNAAVLNRLLEIGVGVGDITDQLTRGEQGANEFAHAFVRTLGPQGQAALEQLAEKADLTTTAFVAALAQGQQLTQLGAQTGQPLTLAQEALQESVVAATDAFREQQEEQEASAKFALLLKVGTEDLNTEEQKQLDLLTKDKDNRTGFVTLLAENEERLLGVADATTEAAVAADAAFEANARLAETQGALVITNQQANDSWVALALGIASGRIATEDYAAAANLLNVDDVGAFADAVNASIQGFVDTATSQLPLASAAFDDIWQDGKIAAGEIKANFERVITESLRFGAVINRLAEEGFVNLAAAVAEQGPAAAAAVADLFADAPDKIPELEALAAGAKASVDAAGVAIEEAAPDIVTKTGTLADDIEAEFEVDFAGATVKGLLDAFAVFDTVDVPPGVKRVGTAIGAALADGLKEGAQDGVKGTGEQMIDDVHSGARRQGEIFSPSRLFADLGRDIVAGLAQGIRDNDELIASGRSTVQSLQVEIERFSADLAPLRVPAPLDPRVIEQAQVVQFVGAPGAGEGEPGAVAILERLETAIANMPAGTTVQGPLVGEVNEVQTAEHVAAELAWTLRR